MVIDRCLLLGFGGFVSGLTTKNSLGFKVGKSWILNNPIIEPPKNLVKKKLKSHAFGIIFVSYIIK